MPRRALVNFVVQGWTGWTREQPRADSVQLTVHLGQKLTPATIGIESFWSYEITVHRIFADRIVVLYNGMVIQNANGTVNLSAPRQGQCIIKVQHCMTLSNATMDGGITLKLTLLSLDCDEESVEATG